MMRQLPSLNGLRAFEAAGRHGSFTAAARELNVTQTAVSRLVRLLADRFGFPLFLLHANALELTAQGQALLSGLTYAFDFLAWLSEIVPSMRSCQVFAVVFVPLWLSPLLNVS